MLGAGRRTGRASRWRGGFAVGGGCRAFILRKEFFDYRGGPACASDSGQSRGAGPADRRAGTDHMRTTVAMLIASREGAMWAHAGDSRLYWFRDGKIREQTRDDSVPQRLVDAGEISAGQIRFHEDRSKLLNSLGGARAGGGVTSSNARRARAGRRVSAGERRILGMRDGVRNGRGFQRGGEFKRTDRENGGARERTRLDRPR